MYYRKSKLKVLKHPGSDPLECLTLQQSDALRTFGLARTKYILSSGADRIGWLIESGLVNQDMHPSLKGRSLSITYRAIKREHEISFWKLSTGHRKLIAKRLRRSSSCRLTENEVLSRLCELQWLRHLESRDYRIDSSDGLIPDYRNSKELNGLVDKFTQMEIADGLAAKYIDPSIVDMRTHEELGLIENVNGRVVITADGSRAHNSFRKFVNDTRSRIMLDVKHDEARKHYFESFSVSAQLAGVWPAQATENFINRLCVKHFTAFRHLMGGGRMRHQKQNRKQSVNIEREDSQRFACEEFFAIAGEMSRVVSYGISQPNQLTAMPYQLSENIDPCGQHLYAKYTHITEPLADERLPIGTVSLSNVVDIASAKDKE